MFFNSVNGKQIQVRERKLFPIVGAVAEVSFIVSAEIHSLCWCFLYSTTSSHVVRKDQFCFFSNRSQILLFPSALAVL